MGKVCLGAGGTGLTAFGAYAAAAATLGSQPQPWYLTVLLVVSALAFLVFVVTGIIWIIQKFKVSIKKNQAIGYIPLHREAVDSCRVAWGLWYTGDEMRGKGLFRSGKFKRVLLLNPSIRNENIEQNAKVVKSDASEIRKEIELARQEAERAKIIIRYYHNRLPPQSYTIFDPNPIEISGDLIPKSKEAWICTQQLTPEVERSLRPREKYENNGERQVHFEAFFRQFEEIWANESVEPNDMETPFQNIQIIKDKQLSLIEVKPQVGRRDYPFQHKHLMWIELDVTNTSSTQSLTDVEVQINNLIEVSPVQDQPNKVLLYSLNKFNPTGICWSERFASPNQLKMLLPCKTTKSVLLAFCDDSNGQWAIYNAPISPNPRHLGGARVELKISSPDCTPWSGVFYIECHPNYITKDWPYRIDSIMEIEDWDKWLSKKNISEVVIINKDMQKDPETKDD
jgi:flagellar assembly factor FliW